jgi:hypothetical protein
MKSQAGGLKTGLTRFFVPWSGPDTRAIPFYYTKPPESDSSGNEIGKRFMQVRPLEMKVMRLEKLR